MTSDQAIALELTKGHEPTPNTLVRVGSVVGEQAARWAFTQWELRRRAKAKFTHADEMLFDRDGLEMASHERLAAYHASQFVEGEVVADLCCGVGSDLVAISERGPAIGFELDPVRAECARHNLAVRGLDAVVQEASADLDTLASDSVFTDPQRRREQEYGSPDPRELKGGQFHTVCAKLGTGLDIEQVRRELFERVEAVSFGGECRELLAWQGREPGIFAVHIESGSVLESGDPEQYTDEPGAFLFQADPAAIKARCLGSLGLDALGDSNGYLTADGLVESPWLRPYRVLWHGSADRKATQAEIARLDGRVVEVKTRGVKEPADVIRDRFKPGGARPLTLVVWPVGKSLRHALVESPKVTGPGSRQL